MRTIVLPRVHTRTEEIRRKIDHLHEVQQIMLVKNDTDTIF